MFEEFLSLTSEQKERHIKKCLDGFDERQRKREIEFEAQAKSREPSEKFYERRYDI